jgi:hypothetical protein
VALARSRLASGHVVGAKDPSQLAIGRGSTDSAGWSFVAIFGVTMESDAQTGAGGTWARRDGREVLVAVRLA